AGTLVPTLAEVLAQLASDRRRRIYLDLKQVDLDRLAETIAAADVGEQVLFVHGDPAMCLALSRHFPGCTTMTWISGSAGSIRSRFAALAERQFEGVGQLQFHLQARRKAPIAYALDDAFLKEA